MSLVCPKQAQRHQRPDDDPGDRTENQHIPFHIKCFVPSNMGDPFFIWVILSGDFEAKP
jgi:hypothetical protein